MNRNVLIYGFGWCGKSMLEFCRQVGFVCHVVDDGIDLRLTRDPLFIPQTKIKEHHFDFILVTIKNKEVAKKVAHNLLKLGLDEKSIGIVDSYAYRDNMAYLIEKFCGNGDKILLDWLEDSLYLPHFHKKLDEMVNYHREHKKNRTVNDLEFLGQINEVFGGQSVFSKLHLTGFAKNAVHIAYPGFNIATSEFKKEDRDFYFIEKIDWEAVANRPKDVKLIAFLGNSALRVEYLPKEDTITSFMRDSLGDKIIILNFGVIGYTIYEQMMLYNALVYPLKPEIVLSSFIGTDYRNGLASCEVLTKRHKMTYTSGFYEYAYKDYARSEMPLYTAMMVENPKVSERDINEAVVLRLRQFHDIVVGGGASLWHLSSPYYHANKNGVGRRRQ